MANTPATGRHWLRGHRAALILTFDIDAESCMLAEGRRYAAHPNVMSHQAFGPLVGVPRILDMLGAQQVRATFFVPGVTAGRYPELIRRIDAQGHEIGHHSYSHRPPQLLTEEEERRDFEQGLDALDQLGTRPDEIVVHHGDTAITPTISESSASSFFRASSSAAVRMPMFARPSACASLARRS